MDLSFDKLTRIEEAGDVLDGSDVFTLEDSFTLFGYECLIYRHLSGGNV